MEKTAKQFGQRLFRNIILRGTQAARNDDHLRRLLCPLHGAQDLLPIVANRALLVHNNAGSIQVFGNRDRVRIDNLTDQNLITDGNNGSLHNSIVIKKNGVATMQPPP